MNDPQHDDLPPFCVEGAVPDLYGLFAQLRELWRSAEEDRTYTQLAEWLGVPAQNVSQWATGSGKKSPPPWHVIMRLCDSLDLVVVQTPEITSLHRAPSK